MPTMPPTHHSRAHATKRDLYERRGTRIEQGYTNAWLRAAKRFKQEHPLCVLCEAGGRVTPAQCVDHIIPHGGNSDLFWNEDNWQSLCNPCHSGPKRRAELAAKRDAPRTVGRRGVTQAG